MEGQSEVTTQIDETERKKLEAFLVEHKVSSSEATAKAISIAGVTLEHLMGWREQDIELTLQKINKRTKRKAQEMCKEANIGWRSRADILKALNKIPESRVHKEFEAKIRPKPSTSQVIILHPTEHEKMNQIYEKLKQVSQKIGSVESQIIELEENSKKAKQGISDTCKSIIAAKKKELLDKSLKQLKKVQQQFKTKNEQITECINEPNIDINEKRQKLQQLLRDEVHKNIGGSVWNDNEKEADACINFQFANKKKKIDLVQMVDQLLKQQMII
ncbi:hypothetical protein RFI_33020, partial [Reticulomyxa filosa]